MAKLFQRLVMILCGFGGAKIVTSEQKIKNIRKSPKYNLNTILPEILLHNLNGASKFRGCHTNLQSQLTFFGVFLGRNFLKAKHFLKNIHKYEKKVLNNNFVKSLNMYLK